MKYKVIFELDNKKIIDFLEYYHLGKAKIHNLFQNKLIYVNGKLANRFTNIKFNDEVEIIEDVPKMPNAYSHPLEVLYEDDYLLIINKPAFKLIYSDVSNQEVINIVSYYLKEKGINCNVHPNHRLDYETTGILVFSKDMLTESYMNYYFTSHTFKREYFLITEGISNHKKGKITFNIGRDRHNRSKYLVTKNGQTAITNYELIRSKGNLSLYKAVLETGRTHQIRVHFKEFGLPLLGDKLYNKESKLINRVALHSYSFSFIHPFTNEKMIIKCNLPLDMKSLIGENNETKDI